MWHCLHTNIISFPSLSLRYLRVWDTIPKTDEEKAKFRQSGKKKEPSIWSLSGHTDAITCVAWSPLGTYACIVYEEVSYHNWFDNNSFYRPNPQTPVSNSSVDLSVIITKSHFLFHYNLPYQNVKLGDKIASGGSDQLIIIREALRRGAVLATFVGHTSNVLSLCFAPDGTKLVSGSLDQTVRCLYLTLLSLCMTILPLFFLPVLY